ncbi:MAG: hypothetical protein IAI49_09940, partial [Candidatus Eremiobacteraeota bacterium]|nr:hypothetical protein [Candidatus Eremiobacteraeota bacterium]
MPLTANGKLDRRALSVVEIETESPILESAEQSGVSNLESDLQAVFAELLGVPHVGLDDSFFALGGHSLLAARLAARIETKFPSATKHLRERDGRGAILRVFYSQPTVRALAATLEGDRVEDSPIVRMRDGNPERNPVFWLHGMYNGDGLYTWDMLSGMPADVPFYVVHPHGYDNRPFESDVRKLAKDHLELIREVCPHGPYVIGGFCNGALIAYEIALQLRDAGEVVDDLILVSLPPLYPGAETLYRSSRRLCDALGVSDARRSSWLRFARITNARLSRFVHGTWQKRLSMIRAALFRERQSVLEYAVGLDGVSFADPGAKHEQYLNAIARYAIKPYMGRTTLIYGTDVAPTRNDFARGWGRYLSHAELMALPGGHFS